MDNTDTKRRVILIQKRYNHLTGESIIKKRPKLSQRKKIIVARGKGKKTIGNILLAKLRPFTFAIKKGLYLKGYNVAGMPFKTLVVLYYNEFTGLKPINVSYFINNVSFKITPDDDINGDIDDVHNKQQFVEITEVVNGIVELFKQAKEKYESLLNHGFDPDKTMKDEELMQAKASFIVLKGLLSEFKSDNYLKVGQVNNTFKWLVGFLLVFYLLTKI